MNNRLQNLTVGGGTPTGESLKFLANYAPLLDPSPASPRDDFVLLITDGLPNCNSSNAKNCNDVAACKCTLTPATACTPASFCTQGCLDDNSTVGAVQALRNKGIKTIVVGFGAETATGDGPATLNAMSVEGGFARTCADVDAGCGSGDPCDPASGLCSRKYYQATTEAELRAVLEEVFR